MSRAIAVGADVMRANTDARTPRDFDDLMDGLADRLPAYSRELIEALRQFRLTGDVRETSPAITREAAHHIERLEAENVLLARMAGCRAPQAKRSGCARDRGLT